MFSGKGVLELYRKIFQMFVDSFFFINPLSNIYKGTAATLSLRKYGAGSEGDTM